MVYYVQMCIININLQIKQFPESTKNLMFFLVINHILLNTLEYVVPIIKKKKLFSVQTQRTHIIIIDNR